MSNAPRSELGVDPVVGEGGALVPGRGRIKMAVGLLLGWSALFSLVLVEWVKVALSADLHSHLVLIPVVTGYLLWVERGQLQIGKCGGRIGGALLVLAGLAVWLASPWLTSDWNRVDDVALRIGGYLLGVWGIILAVMGKSWVRSALFPLGFLVFMIPLPGAAEAALENGLMTASARVSEWVFGVGGVPVYRQGQVLELPGITLEVAEECSGIRSTLVLFITSVLAAYLFLPTLPRRLILIAAVLPLGVLRNSIRIYVIGWLCVEHGPEMINHWLHRHGGPLFFAASLVPLLLLALLLRRKSSAVAS